jgi:hypothetical protein
MKKVLLILVICLIPALAMADWKEDLIKQLKEEGYSKREIESLVDDEEKRRAKKESEKASKEGKNGSSETGGETGGEAGDEVSSGDTSKTDKEKRSEWVDKEIGILKIALEENGWTDTETLKRVALTRTFLRNNYGKDEEEIKVGYQSLLKDLAVAYAKTALRKKKPKSVCLHEVYEAYEKFVDYPPKKRKRVIVEIYNEVEDEIKAFCQKNLKRAEKEASKSLELIWEKYNIESKDRTAKKKSLRAIFDVMGDMITKRDYNEKLKNVYSKTKFSAKEKKVISGILKLNVPDE